MQVNGTKIRRLREDMGLTGRDLAEAAMISPPHLSLIERGRRNAGPHVAARLAKVLEVAIVDLRSPDAFMENSDRGGRSSRQEYGYRGSARASRK